MNIWLQTLTENNQKFGKCCSGIMSPLFSFNYRHQPPTNTPSPTAPHPTPHVCELPHLTDYVDTDAVVNNVYFFSEKCTSELIHLTQSLTSEFPFIPSFEQEDANAKLGTVPFYIICLVAIMMY